MTNCIKKPYGKLKADLINDSSGIFLSKLVKFESVEWFYFESRFPWSLQGLVWLDLLTNFDAKGAKRSVIHWALKFHKGILSQFQAVKNKIRPLHKYEVLWMFYFSWICRVSERRAIYKNAAKRKTFRKSSFSCISWIKRDSKTKEPDFWQLINVEIQFIKLLLTPS